MKRADYSRFVITRDFQSSNIGVDADVCGCDARSVAAKRFRRASRRAASCSRLAASLVSMALTKTSVAPPLVRFTLSVLLVLPNRARTHLKSVGPCSRIANRAKPPQPRAKTVFLIVEMVTAPDTFSSSRLSFEHIEINTFLLSPLYEVGKRPPLSRIAHSFRRLSRYLADCGSGAFSSLPTQFASRPRAVPRSSSSETILNNDNIIEPDRRRLTRHRFFLCSQA